MSDQTSPTRWRGPDSQRVVVRAANGAVIADRVTVARSFVPRFMGLMGRAKLDPREGLWLIPCNSVHMFFMRSRLDIVYLDRQMRVVRCDPEMPKWTVKLLPVRHAHSALELAPGTLGRHGVRPGDALKIGADTETAPEAAPSLVVPGVTGV
ncbi:MAG TPA: DUF192 domain-containing protein [Candidatus Dormibacteraeota bacterium]